MLQGKPLYTGVVGETDMKGTLDIALRLHPETKQVMVINDRTTTGLALKEQLSALLHNYSNRVSFVIYDDFDIEELKETVRGLKKGALVFLLVVNRDKYGRFFTYEESLAIIRGNSNVPIYSVWDFYLGRGIVGGMLTSAYEQGRAAGEIAKRLLEGIDVRDIPINKRGPNLYMFDYNELKRFGIDMKGLPKDSTLINQPDTFYTRYKRLIFATIGIMTFLTLIIVTPIINNIMRRRNTERLLKQSEEKYRDLYDNAPEMYHSVDKQGIIIECNETEARLLGYEKSEIIGRPITDFLSERSKKDHEREFPGITSLGDKTILEREFVRKDGTVFLASLNVFIEKDSKGELVRTKTIARDITRQRQIEEELRNLSLHLQSAVEDERKTIARDIHDELGHSMTTIKLDLSWLKNRL